MPRPQSRPTRETSIPTSFAAKKAEILSLLEQPDDAYTDKSPKGTVDAQIRELIAEINAYDGLVTTSSCAGRVAVFVEGPKSKAKGNTQSDSRSRSKSKSDSNAESINTASAQVGDDVRDDLVTIVDATRKAGEDDVVDGGDEEESPSPSGGVTDTVPVPTATASPGGKGGGRWLYVSHDPIDIVPRKDTGDDGAGCFIRMFNLSSQQDASATSTSTSTSASTFTPTSTSNSESNQNRSSNYSDSPSQTRSSSKLSSSPRLVHLSFSPLILHILCATLHHARPVLAAAINAGFRESGLQSLRVMDDPEHGVMVAVRTAGLAFETVVGLVDQDASGQERVHPLVSEEYLALCAGVVNERFAWNNERRERFRAELRRAMEREGLASTGAAAAAAAADGDAEASASRRGCGGGWEDKDERRRRKRDEGLLRQKKEKETTSKGSSDAKSEPTMTIDELDDGLATLEMDR